MAEKSTGTAQKPVQNSVKEGPLDSIFLALANMYEQMGKVDNALGVYNNILKRNPKCVTALVGRGVISLLNFQDEKAFKDLHKACALAPRDKNALRARGLFHMITANFETAQKDFQKSFDSGDWDSLTVLFSYSTKLKTNGPDDASAFLADAVTNQIKIKEWPFPIVQFLKGDIQMTTLMDLAFTKPKQLETRAYLGFEKVFTNNPTEGKPDLLFVQGAEAGPSFVRMLAARGVKIIDDGFTQRAAQSNERAERIAGTDWLG